MLGLAKTMQCRSFHKAGISYYQRILVYLLIVLAIQLILSSIGISIATSSGPQQSPGSNDTKDPQTRNQIGTRQSGWSTLKMWNDNKVLNVVEVGDVDHTHPGDEVVVGGESNKLTVIYGFGETWVTETAYVPKEDDWIITSIAIGDIYPHHPGNEIVMVGWSKYVTMVYKSVETNKWVSERLYKDIDWLYDVTIGDIDPTHPGNEIITVGDPRHVLMIYYSNETHSWENKELWANTPADINVVAIGDFDSYSKGSELAIATVQTQLLNLTEIFYNRSSGKWNRHDLGELEKEPLEMVIGDFYSGHKGNELALVSIQRNVQMIYQGGTQNEWHKKNLWRDTESIRDVVIADIIEDELGNELVVAGYSDTVTLIHESSQSSETWESTTTFHGSSNIVNLGVGEFDSFHTGLELVFLEALKDNGRVQKLQKNNLGFNLFTPQPDYEVPAGAEISIPIILSPEGGFSEEVTLNGIDTNELKSKGITLTFNQTKLLPPIATDLLLTTAPDISIGGYKIELSGAAQSITEDVILNFTLSILPQKTSAFNLSVSPQIDSVVADFSRSYAINSNMINDWEEKVGLSIRYLPAGISYSFDNPVITPPEDTKLTITTTSSTRPGRYFIIINSISQTGSLYQYSTVLVLDVLEPKPDFKMEPELNEINLTINSSVSVDISVYSILGFDEELSFEISGLPMGINNTFNPTSLTPTGNTTVKLISTQKIDLGTYNISVLGTSKKSGIQHSTFFHLVMKPEPPGFTLGISPDAKLKYYPKQTAEIEIIISPTGGFEDEVNISVTGLVNTMNWNSEISPVSLDKEAVVQINISGLDKPGNYDIVIEALKENQTASIELTLEVLTEPDDGVPENDNLNLLVIIIVIVILIVILAIVSRLSTAKSKPKPSKPGKRITKKLDHKKVKANTKVDKLKSEKDE